MKYQPLSPVQAAARVERLARTFLAEALADLTDFPDADADCLTVEDFVALGCELGHYANQILDFRAYRRCECGEALTTARELASGACPWCREDAVQRTIVALHDPAFADEVSL